MKPLDLTQHPPRRAGERLDGVVLLPRTIDKLRASLPGGNIGSYKIPGFSTKLLELLGVSEADLLEAVRTASTDDDVAAWVRAHSDPSKYAKINEHFERRTVADLADPEDYHRRYPIAKRLGLTRLIDVLDADDAESFATPKSS
jgi:hypothetical protein